MESAESSAILNGVHKTNAGEITDLEDRVASARLSAFRIRINCCVACRQVLDSLVLSLLNPESEKPRAMKGQSTGSPYRLGSTASNKHPRNTEPKNLRTGVTNKITNSVKLIQL